MDARKEYSEYALNSVNVEDANGIGTVEYGTLALVGRKSVMSEADIKDALAHEGIKPDMHDAFITAMCKLSVLGFEIRDGQFSYVYDDTDFGKYRRLADICAQHHGLRRYSVHPALRPALSIEL
jgi:hypothetical protein